MKMVSTEVNSITFPLIRAVEGYNFPPARLARLAGLTIHVSRFADEENARIAIVRTSDVILALEDDPQRLFWKGYYNAQQPKSYGQLQHEMIDPEFRIGLSDERAIQTDFDTPIFAA